MGKPNGSKGSRLSAEEKSLENRHAEILRQKEKLETRLKLLPAVLQAQEEQKREMARRQAAAAGPAISPYVGRGARRSREKNRARRMPSRERWAAKLKTIGLLILLAIIFLLIYKTIPTA